MAVAKSPYEPVVLGADIGNATTVVARGGEVASFLPSVITRRGVRAYEGLSRVPGTTRHHITYKGRHAVIGADALEMRGHDTILNETAQPHARYLEEESLLCFLAGVSAAFPDADTVGVRLATGAPLSIYEAWGTKIAERYQGRHEYVYNGHRRQVVVEQVRIFGEGREVMRLLSPEERRGNIAVHDLGGKTWNVLLFKDGGLRAARTFDSGTERLLDDVPAASKDPGARWALQSEMRRNPKAHAAIREELARVIAEELATIERKVALPKADRHVLIGGGALHLAGVLRRRYGVAVVTLNGDAPEGANALAYALAASEAA